MVREITPREQMLAALAVTLVGDREIVGKGRVGEALEESFSKVGLEPPDWKIVDWSYITGKKRLLELVCFSVEDDDVRKTFIVPFPTLDLADWPVNMDARKIEAFSKTSKLDTTYPGTNKEIKVHRGFFDAYVNSGIRERLMKWMNECAYENVIVTGYSQGAAESLIISLDLHVNLIENDPQGLNSDVREVITVPWACPRVGNNAFVASFDKRVPCVVFSMRDDLVANVPPEIIGFTHVNRVIWFGPPLGPLSKADYTRHYPHHLFKAWIEYYEGLGRGV